MHQEEKMKTRKMLMKIQYAKRKTTQKLHNNRKTILIIQREEKVNRQALRNYEGALFAQLIKNYIYIEIL